MKVAEMVESQENNNFLFPLSTHIIQITADNVSSIFYPPENTNDDFNTNNVNDNS